MDHQPSTPAVGNTSALFAQNHMSGHPSNGFGLSTGTPLSAASSNMTFQMPVSPVKGRRSSSDGYRPKIARTCGQRPACLVNASVTYCGNNQIYAFGGFDQYTDEGTLMHPLLSHLTHQSVKLKYHRFSVQSCIEARSRDAAMESGG